MSRFVSRTRRARASARTTRASISDRVRLRAGDKTIFTSTELLTLSEATVESFTDDEISRYTVDQLYELAYDGDVDYFSSSTFDEQRKEENEYIANMTRTLDVEESIHECPRCRYTKVAVRQQQLRGGDEGMTTLLRCTKCTYQWRRD